MKERGRRVRHIPIVLVLLAGLVWLAGCGTEAQVTAVVVANAAAATATAATQSAAATTTAALGAVPSGLPLPSGGPPNSSVAPILPTARSSGASPPPIVATVRSSALPSPSGSRPPIGLPSALPTVQPSGSGAGGTVLPVGFPLPSQYQVVSSIDSGGQLLVVLSVSSGQDAYTFYKGALPGAGYQVNDPGGVTVPGAGFIGTLSITSAAYEGSIAFTPGATNDQAVTIQLRPK